MKVLIVYFSQTGNTRAVAKAIRRGAQQAGAQADLVALKRATPELMDEYDLVGIGSPVWKADPINVRKFLKNLPERPGKHVFLFCTHGTMPDLYFPIVQPRLTRKGWVVIGRADWYADDFQQQSPNPYFTAGHPDETDLAEAECYGAEMVERSRRIAAGDSSLIPPPPVPNIPSIQSVAVVNLLLEEKNSFSIKRNAEKCVYPKCRLCVENCPMSFNDYDGPTPRFGSSGCGCDMRDGCSFCELICPTGAIYADPDWSVWDQPSDKAHQDPPPFAAVLSQAEADGKFRRLVPEEEVLRAPKNYQVHNHRPRFVIRKDNEPEL